MPLAFRQIFKPLLWAINAIASWGVGFKVRWLVVMLLVVPALIALVLLESNPGLLRLLLAVVLLATIICFSPICRALAYLLVGKELKDIDRFCLRLKEGDYGCGFDLPHENEDEHEIIALKRNLNWMAHVISHRESWLQTALAGAHQDRDRYEVLSNLDGLTGLANRRCFEQRLDKLALEADLTKRPLSLMFIDCDHFKSVNDNYGHQAGDALLQTLADIIRHSVRQHVDVPFRYGGDEFGVVCVGMTPPQAAEAAERIRSEFLKHRIGQTTLSVGVAGYIRQGAGKASINVAKIIKAADKAAYQAKEHGGNLVVIAPEHI
jgi:diguanylate cyclase (GGDEF)-like protein